MRLCCRRLGFWMDYWRSPTPPAIQWGNRWQLPHCCNVSGCLEAAEGSAIMADVEVYIDLAGSPRPVGLLRRHASRREETVTFEYDETWLADDERFSIEPALALTRGVFPTAPDQSIFGSIGDSAPDTWGRRLMQRAERRQAERDGRRVRTLGELDYLLGVADETRLGALRFRWSREAEFQAPVPVGVPALIELGRLLQITERILRDEETDEDLQLIFAPGSSLGGARPNASVVDQYGHLSIAKFPKETDEYSIEAWEEVALRLAEREHDDLDAALRL
jgi:serine/threonine-protein kinase HipA